MPIKILLFPIKTRVSFYASISVLWPKALKAGHNLNIKTDGNKWSKWLDDFWEWETTTLCIYFCISLSYTTSRSMSNQENLWFKPKKRDVGFKYRFPHLCTWVTFSNFQQFLKFSVVIQMLGMSLPRLISVPLHVMNTKVYQLQIISRSSPHLTELDIYHTVHKGKMVKK